jgi:hypothetical protein
MLRQAAALLHSFGEKADLPTGVEFLTYNLSSLQIREARAIHHEAANVLANMLCSAARFIHKRQYLHKDI